MATDRRSNQTKRAQEKFQSPYGRPPIIHANKKPHHCHSKGRRKNFNATVTDSAVLSDPAIDALWAVIDKGCGDDIGSVETIFHKALSLGRSAGMRLANLGIYDARSDKDSAEFQVKIAHWKRAQAQALLVACIETGQSELLPSVIGLGEELDLPGALALAAAENRPACALFLCGFVCPDDLISKGKTALMWAVVCGSAAAVEALLPLSNIDAKSLNGNTALDIARANGLDIDTREDAGIDWIDFFPTRSKGHFAFGGSTGMTDPIDTMRQSREIIRGLLESWSERGELQEAIVGGNPLRDIGERSSRSRL